MEGVWTMEVREEVEEEGWFLWEVLAVLEVVAGVREGVRKAMALAVQLAAQADLNEVEEVVFPIRAVALAQISARLVRPLHLAVAQNLSLTATKEAHGHLYEERRTSRIDRAFAQVVLEARGGIFAATLVRMSSFALLSDAVWAHRLIGYAKLPSPWTILCSRSVRVMMCRIFAETYPQIGSRYREKTIYMRDQMAPPQDTDRNYTQNGVMLRHGCQHACDPSTKRTLSCNGCLWVGKNRM